MTMGGLGFRRIETHNVGFLMKLAFQFMASKEALWVQLMRAKYKCRDMVLSSLNIKSGSRLCKGLDSVWGDMRHNVVWCWGNGHDISFWYDTWIGDLGLLAQHTLSIVDSVLARATVSDMVDGRGRWLWEKFHGFLPMYVLMHMDVVKGPTRDRARPLVARLIAKALAKPCRLRYAQQGDDVIAFGGAIRDDVGGWKHGFSRLIGVVDAELWAIYDRLLMLGHHT
ncbi:hypothetical protein V6N13_029619 [Hibiscus sabdariffa]